MYQEVTNVHIIEERGPPGCCCCYMCLQAQFDTYQVQLKESAHARCRRWGPCIRTCCQHSQSPTGQPQSRWHHQHHHLLYTDPAASSRQGVWATRCPRWSACTRATRAQDHAAPAAAALLQQCTVVAWEGQVAPPAQLSLNTLPTVLSHTPCHDPPPCLFQTPTRGAGYALAPPPPNPVLPCGRPPRPQDSRGMEGGCPRHPAQLTRTHTPTHLYTASPYRFPLGRRLTPLHGSNPTPRHLVSSAGAAHGTSPSAPGPLPWRCRCSPTFPLERCMGCTRRSPLHCRAPLHHSALHLVAAAAVGLAQHTCLALQRLHLVAAAAHNGLGGGIRQRVGHRHGAAVVHHGHATHMVAKVVHMR